MDKLISAEAFKKIMEESEYLDECLLDDAPEAVVRCKDCRFFHKYGFKLEYTECTHFDCDVTEDGYCWWGERREGNA